ncbi:MAG: hypothetical protein ACKOA2_04710 [Ilumatobacteraceae bacterium]
MASAKKSAAKRSATTTASAKKAGAKKSPAKKASTKTVSAKKAPAKKSAPVKKGAAKKTSTKSTSTKKVTAKKAAPSKKVTAKKTSTKSVAAKKAPTKSVSAKRAAPATKASAKKAPVTKVSAKKPSPIAKGSAKSAPAAKSSSAATRKAAMPVAKAPAKAPVKAAPTRPVFLAPPPVKGVTKDGIAYTKDFDVKFLTARWHQLQAEKVELLGQATRLEDEAHQLVEQHEMGDVQFDDEGGEGDGLVVERERDLVLSMQARQTIVDIDAALERLTKGTYGYSTESGRPIPRERLEAIPWAVVLVEEKVGALGRR